jgi:hypothetical protein
VQFIDGGAVGALNNMGAARVSLRVTSIGPATPAPLASRRSRFGARAATALSTAPAAKAVQLAILLLNRPALRAKIASIPQGRELALAPRREHALMPKPIMRLGV